MIKLAVLSVAIGFGTVGATALWYETHPVEQTKVVCIEENHVVPCPGVEQVINREPLLISNTAAWIECPAYGVCLGTTGDDIMIGTDRVNWMIGRGGDDQMYPGKGADILEGRGGNDSGYGGDGRDEFIFVDCNNYDFANGQNGIDKGTFDLGDTRKNVELPTIQHCAK